MSAAPLLETRALTVRAAGRSLVDRLDWQVHAGERWCVIGRNGAGKSLVLRALAGLGVPERAGDVLWQGRPQQAWPVGAAAAVRALMPQQAQDRFALTVERTLALSQVVASVHATSELMSALDIAALATRRADQLSGGERQRVALAQCAMQGAALMLLDEPVSFQDPAHQQIVGRWLAQAAPAGYRATRGGAQAAPAGYRATHGGAQAVPADYRATHGGAQAAPADYRATHGVAQAAPAGQRAWVASAHDPSWIGRVATHVLALFGDGRWQAGPVDEILSESVLERTYGCAWRSVEGAWIPV